MKLKGEVYLDSCIFLSRYLTLICNFISITDIKNVAYNYLHSNDLHKNTVPILCTLFTTLIIIYLIKNNVKSSTLMYS